jgi:hypothetical protein
MMDDDDRGAVGEMIDKEKSKYSKKTCHSGTSLTSNPTLPY